MVQAIPNLDTWRTLPSKIQVLFWLTWQSLFVLFVHTLRWHSTCSCLYLDKCIVGLICAVDISILITHCHMDGHVFIQKEWHVFMMTIFHPSCMGILLCFASPWQSLQEAQHDLPTSLTLSLEVWDVLDHEYVETREMSSIYAKQLAQLNTQQGCLLLLNVQQVRCEEIYIYSDVVVQSASVVYAAGCWVPHLTMYGYLSSVHGTVVHASKWLIIVLLGSYNTLVSSCTTRTCFWQPRLYVLRDNIILLLPKCV